MTKTLIKLFAVILMALTVCSIVLGQNGKNPGLTQNQTLEKESEDRRKRVLATNVIEAVAEEAGHWAAKREAVQVLADAAALLWHNDPNKGRKWLRKAWSLVGQISEASDGDNPLSEFFRRSVKTDLHNRVLKVAARYDQELFDGFLEDLDKRKADAPRSRGAFDDRTPRSEQLLRLAAAAVGTNPELAFSLATRSLSDGVSPSLQYILTGLRRTRADLANQLFDLALRGLSQRDVESVEAEVLAGYLFRSGFTFSTNASEQVILVLNPLDQDLPAVASSEPDRAKDFLVLVHQVFLLRSLSDEKDQRRHSLQTALLVNRLLDQYRIYAPELLPSVHGLLAKIRRDTDFDRGNLHGFERRSPSPPRDANLDNDYEAQLRKLEEDADNNRDPVARKLAYAAAALAVRTEDYKRARGIAAKISDNELRSDIISFLNYRAALFYVRNGRIDEAESLAKEIGETLRRAVARIAISQVLLSSAEKLADDDRALHRQRAFALVIDLERDLRKVTSPSSARILLAITAVISRLDKIQALTSLESAIQVINKLEDFDLSDSAAPDLSFKLSTNSRATLFQPKGFDFRSAVQVLADSEFEQVVGMASRFVRKEMSGVGRIEAASTYLSLHALPQSFQSANDDSGGKHH